MKTKRFLIYAFSIFAFIAFSSSQTLAQKLTVSNIKSDEYGGCGCSLQTLAEAKKRQSIKMVFWSEDRKTAVFNINGKDTNFKLVKEGKRPKNEKIGSRFSDEYAAGGIRIKIDYVTTRVCLRGEENCEATFYDATITATKGSVKTIVKTKGACGC